MIWKKQTKHFSIKNFKIFYFVDALFDKLQHHMLEFNFFEETELALPPGGKELKTVQLIWEQALERLVYLVYKVLRDASPEKDSRILEGKATSAILVLTQAHSSSY